MINTRKFFGLFAVLGLAFLILQIGNTESKPISEESIRLDSASSGDNGIPEELKEDDLNGEGSGDAMENEKPRLRLQSNGITDKQVEKLIQAQDLGTGESEGSASNSIPEFKEANDGSGEVIEVEKHKGEGSKVKDLEFPNTLESTKDASAQEKQPTIVTPAADTTVQPGAQVFSDTTATGQSQPYAAPATTTQPEEQYYNDAQPGQQTYSASAQPEAAAAATQPAASYYNDAAAPAQPAAQYYNDAAAPQTTSTAQSAVEPVETPAQPSADNIPAPVDVAMEATHPGEQASYYASNNPAAQPSNVFSDANGVPQPVDAASMATSQQPQYYNSQAQQADQQTAASAPASPVVADNSAALQQWNSATAAAQQPMQYTSQTSEQQNAASTNQNDQSIQAVISPDQKMRETDEVEENKFRTVVCQNSQDVISCPEGKKINIIDAHYGSMGASACQGMQSNFLPMQPCETPGAQQTVKASCDDAENCVLSANDGIFGGSCQSDRKYLDVTYKCDANEDTAQAQQYYYPNGQPGAPAYSPYYQGYQQQQEQQLNDQPNVALPPPPKIPELMSTLLQLSKNRKNYDQSTCNSCNRCNQCYSSARCAQCDFCKNRLCDEAAASLPMIPKNLRPLWEMWNERTADMNSMEMSALILSPPKLRKHKAKVTGSSTKRSHIKKPKITKTPIKHIVKSLKKASKKQ